MSVKTIQTSSAPAAIGPYSQGIVANGFLFTAGQIALNPETGAMETGDITAQTNRVLSNLGAIFAEAGVTWADVVKTTIFLNDLTDFSVVNEIYGRALGAARPARSTVQAAALPRGALVEIDAIVRVGG